MAYERWLEKLTAVVGTGKCNWYDNLRIAEALRQSLAAEARISKSGDANLMIGIRANAH